MHLTETDTPRATVPDERNRRATGPLESLSTTTVTDEKRFPEPERARAGHTRSERARSVSSLAGALRKVRDTTVPAVEPAAVDPRPALRPEDRRRLPRRVSRSAVRVAAYSSEAAPDEWTLRQAAKCEVHDLTLKSMAYASDSPIEAGTRLVARLARRPGDPEVLDVVGRVLRCQAGAKGFDVVVTFERALTLEQLETYGRPVLEADLV